MVEVNLSYDKSIEVISLKSEWFTTGGSYFILTYSKIWNILSTFR